MDSTPSSFSYQVRGPLPHACPSFVAVNEPSPSPWHSPGRPVWMAFFWWMTHKNSSKKGKLLASRSSQGTAMMKELCFLFLRPTSRKRAVLSMSVVSLMTEFLQDRGGAAHLRERIHLSQGNGCPDGRAAYAVPSQCHSGFAIRHGYPKCSDSGIQTHCFYPG